MSVAVTTRKKRKTRSRWRQFFAALQLLILSVFAVGLVFTAVTIWNLSTILPQGGGAIGELESIESTKILSANGQELATVFMDENREYVPISKIPKMLKDATIATEDKRFYDHNGVDFRGIARALVEDIRTGARSQGGSTITQQLVRDVYLTQRKSVGRKIQEALLAVQIERKYSKDEILEKYLNQVFYGAGAYGVQAAAHTYFGKKVGDLDLAECAMIAGLPQRPTAYNPYRNMKYAKWRRDTVLGLMEQTGVITHAQATKAQAEPIKLAYSRPSGSRVRRAPYFVDYVLDDLIDRYGANTVYKGGLRVYTTLLPGMQAAADKAIKNGVKHMADQHVTQGALVSIDPRTGYIRAMVGGVNYKKSQLNRAYLNKHPRSPGSSFKPFVYTAAFEQGMDPYDTVADEPISIDDGGHAWKPRNYDDKWFGTITIQRAIAMSRNIPAIKTIQKVGVQNAINTAHRLGIVSPLGKNLSLAIGTSGVTLVEMASAYGAFANDGNHAEPISILKILDRDGNLIEQNKPRVKKVLKPEVEAKIDQCLRAVTTQGTAMKVGRAISESRGKTGTAQDDRDAWFMGYVPHQLVTAVWVGNDDNSQMRKVFGGTNCAPIWIEFMEKALKMNPKMKSPPKPEADLSTEAGRKKEAKKERHRSHEEDDEPAEEPRRVVSESDADVDKVHVRLCADTGLLATASCPSTYVETFTPGDEPTEACNLHPGRRLNGESSPRRSPSEEKPTPTSADPAMPTGGETGTKAAPTDEDAPSDARRANASTEQTERRVRVRLCVQSGLLATRYCTDTIQRRLPESEVPKEFCNLHGPP